MSFVSVTLILFKTQKKNSFYIVSALFHHLITILSNEKEKNWKFFGDCCTPNFTFHFRLYPFVDRCCLQPIFNSSYNNHNKNGIEIAIKQQGALKNSKKVQFAEGVLFASSTVFEKISEWKGPFVLQSEGNFFQKSLILAFEVIVQHICYYTIFQYLEHCAQIDRQKKSRCTIEQFLLQFNHPLLVNGIHGKGPQRCRSVFLF